MAGFFRRHRFALKVLLALEAGWALFLFVLLPAAARVNPFSWPLLGHNLFLMFGIGLLVAILTIGTSEAKLQLARRYNQPPGDYDQDGS